MDAACSTRPMLLHCHVPIGIDVWAHGGSVGVAEGSVLASNRAVHLTTCTSPPALQCTTTFLNTTHLQNVDPRTKTVRLRAPKGHFFSTRGFQQSIKLAGGLETTFEVGHGRPAGSPCLGEGAAAGAGSVDERAGCSCMTPPLPAPQRSLPAPFSVTCSATQRAACACACACRRQDGEGRGSWGGSLGAWPPALIRP